MHRAHVSRRQLLKLSLAAASTTTLPSTLQRARAQEATPAAVSVPSNVTADFGAAEIRIGASTEYYAYALRLFQEQVEKDFNVKLKIDVVPANDMYQRNLTEFTTGSSSYDFFMFLPFQLPDYAAHLEPLDTLTASHNLDLMLDDILPAFRDIYSTWDGALVSMPFDGDVHLMMYNKDAFENPDLQEKFKADNGTDLAVPETYDQYVQVAQFFTENPWRTDGQQGYGVAEGFGGPEWWWENRFGAYGGVYFDENMTPLVNSANGVAATENLVQTAKYAPPGANSAGYQEVENALIKGDVALSINWSSAYRTSTNPDKSTTVGRIGVATTPGAMVNGELNRRDALCTGWSLGISKYAKNKDAAAYLVWFYSSPEVLSALILDPDTGIDAYRTSSLDSEEFAAKYGEEYVQTIKDALGIGFPDLQVPNATEYYQRLSDGLKEAIVGTQSSEDAMNNVANEWNSITDRMGTDLQKAAWNKAYETMKAQGIAYIPMK